MVQIDVLWPVEMPYRLRCRCKLTLLDLMCCYQKIKKENSSTNLQMYERHSEMRYLLCGCLGTLLEHLGTRSPHMRCIHQI